MISRRGQRGPQLTRTSVDNRTLLLQPSLGQQEKYHAGKNHYNI